MAEQTPTRSAAAVGRAPADDETPAVDIGRVVRACWRAKWLIAATGLVAAIAGAAVAFQLPPRYTAAAKVLLHAPQANVIDVDEVLSGTPYGRDSGGSEVEIITSTANIRQVIERLDLIDRPEFTAAGSGILDGIGRWVNLDSVKKFLGGGREAAAGSVGASTDYRAVRTLLANLSVRPVPYSRVVVVAYTATSPDLAASVANAVADQYLLNQLDAKFEATAKATEWLSAKVAELREQLEESERAIAVFRAEQALAEGQGIELTKQQLEKLNDQLIEAREDRVGAETLSRRMRSLLERGEPGELTLSIPAAETLNSLIAARADLAERRAALAASDVPQEPQIDALDERIKVGDERITAEAHKVLRTLDSELALAESREDDLRKALTALEAKLNAQSESAVVLRQLEREAESRRLVYESFLQRLNETSAKEGTQQADAQIIARAEAPAWPTAPNKRRITALAGAGGVMLALLAVCLLEAMNRRVRLPEDVETETGLPVIGLLPAAGRARSAAQILDSLQKQRNSALAEAARGLLLGLAGSPGERAPKVIQVTSAAPGEGKSVTSALLAAVGAQMGKSTLLIEADLRRPGLARAFGVSPGPGIVSALEAEPGAPLSAAKGSDRGPDLLVVTPEEARSAVNAAERLASSRFDALLAEARRRYDLVIVDTPPVLSVSDALSVAAKADTILFVAAWDRTLRQAAAEGIRQLDLIEAPLGGVALTMVDLKAMARISSGVFYGSYAEGYTT